MNTLTEPFNVISHLFGAILNGAVALVLAAQALNAGHGDVALGLAVFGLCMSTSYLASVAYHAKKERDKKQWLRRDRAGIYLAIAGFHTVNALTSLSPAARAPFLLGVWALALFFIGRELHRGQDQEPTGILGYCLLGACGLAGWQVFTMAPEEAGLMWRAVTILMFAVGVVLLRCRFIPANHEMWHIMVVGGNMSMFAGWSESIPIT